jgi:hypothetical protein
MEQIIESDLLGVRRVIDVPPEDAITMVAYGGGVNSTALLCGWIERGLRPVDVVIFSDTGGERPETYRYVDTMSEWLVGKDYPPIVVVRAVNRVQAVKTLEDECLRHESLPSLAYGFKTCSLEFKNGPQVKWMNHWPPAQRAWKQRERIVKLIGYDADEPHRAGGGTREDAKYWYRYPLIEWGWGRLECVEAIQRAGLPVPPKSACFFCPANTVTEIKDLQRDHPDLLARALAMEATAATKNTSVSGLGRRFSWRDLIHGKPLLLFDTEIACECYDGGADLAAEDV